VQFDPPCSDFPVHYFVKLFARLGTYCACHQFLRDFNFNIFTFYYFQLNTFSMVLFHACVAKNIVQNLLLDSIFSILLMWNKYRYANIFSCHVISFKISCSNKLEPKEPTFLWRSARNVLCNTRLSLFR
jgi:hypothetical protein